MPWARRYFLTTRHLIILDYELPVIKISKAYALLASLPRPVLANGLHHQSCCCRCHPPVALHFSLCLAIMVCSEPDSLCHPNSPSKRVASLTAERHTCHQFPFSRHSPRNLMSLLVGSFVAGRQTLLFGPVKGKRMRFWLLIYFYCLAFVRKNWRGLNFF